MTPETSGTPPSATTVEILLDELRDHPEWDETRVAEQFDRLISRFSPEVLAREIRPRLHDLAGGDGEVLLQLVEGLTTPELLDALADALVDQPDLAPDRQWQALGVLEGSGRIETRPLLSEMREELDDLIGGDDTLDELAAQIEDDPDSIAVAIEGLSRIEPDVRTEIIAGLGVESAGPGVRILLRALAESDDPITRSAARDALGERDGPDEIEESKPVIAAGSSDLAPIASSSGILRSAVGPIDGEGRGKILLVADDESGLLLAEFECDVVAGIASATGRSGLSFDQTELALDELGRHDGGDVVRDRHDLALALLGGASWLSGDALPDETRAWIERSTGPGFREGPIFAAPSESRLGTISAARLTEEVEAIFKARPSWRDESELLQGLAVEMLLHDGKQGPDPVRDPGPFRILFENRILGRIELYRRMLLWSALGWAAADKRDLAEAAMRLSGQLADPQNAVPGHPFLSALMVRSLAIAQSRAWNLIAERKSLGSAGPAGLQ